MNTVCQQPNRSDAVNVCRHEEGQTKQRARLVQILDRAIVLLMAAIVLTLAWPVGMALWGQSHAAQAGAICLTETPPNPPRNHRPPTPGGAV